MKQRVLGTRSLTTLALLATLAGCASGPRNVLRMAVGRASRPDVLDKAPRILDQQGYEIQERRDTGQMIQYMTSWVTRAPFDDEAGRGAVECRTRLTLEARLGAGDTYALTLRAENMMQRQSMDGAWVDMVPTPMFREHMQTVSEALALELDMGVRTR
jgi:hypothetical protein